MPVLEFHLQNDAANNADSAWLLYIIRFWRVSSGPNGISQGGLAIGPWNGICAVKTILSLVRAPCAGS